MSGSQTPLLPILSLGDIPVVMTASHETDNLFLLGIHSRQRLSHAQIISTLRTTSTLVPGSQSQNPIEPISLFDDFQQRQEVWLRFLTLLDNKRTRVAIYKYQIKTDDTIIHFNHVYGKCSGFTHQCKLKLISKDNPVVATSFTIGIFCLDQFDSCRCLPQSYILYKEC